MGDEFDTAQAAYDRGGRVMGIDDDGSYVDEVTLDPWAPKGSGVIRASTIAVGIPGYPNRQINTATGTRMSIEEAKAAMKMAAAAMAHAESLTEKYPAIPGALDGTIVAFDVLFNQGSTAWFSFVALKAAGTWHLSGQQYGGSPVYDDALLDFLDGQADVRNFRVLETPGAARWTDLQKLEDVPPGATVRFTAEISGVDGSGNVQCKIPGVGGGGFWSIVKSAMVEVDSTTS